MGLSGFSQLCSSSCLPSQGWSTIAVWAPVFCAKVDVEALFYWSTDYSPVVIDKVLCCI